MPLHIMLIALVFLLVLSGFFSLSETSMMAINRYRLRHLAKQGHRGARLTIKLLDHTDRLLGVILLGNNLLNTASATLVAIIVATLFAHDDFALLMGTIAVTFAILVFSEITPKVIAAAPDQEVPGHLRIPALQSGYTRRRLIAEIIFPRLTVTGSGGFVERVLGVGRSTWFWSSGACLFVNRDLFLEIGGFDERLFMYMEDVAFGKAAYKNGYEIRATGTSFIHKMSTGSEISNRERVRHLTRARIKFARENYRVVGPIALLIGKIKGIF